MDTYLRFRNKWFIKSEKGGIWYFFKKFSDGRIKAIQCNITFAVFLEFLHSLRTGKNKGYFIALAIAFVLVFSIPFIP